MSVNSVEEIINLSESYSNPNRIAYKHLKKQLDSQIRERAVRHGSLSFRTPSILFGKPAFDKASVEKKIVKHYSKIGFACYREPGGGDIIIRWKEEDRGGGGETCYGSETSGSDPDSDADSKSNSDSNSGSMNGSGSGSLSGERSSNMHAGPCSDSGSDGGNDTTKHVVIETSTLSQRLNQI
jgi:hypothetical protein